MSAGRVVIIDNYDSFTFNLVQALGALGTRAEVVRNDAVDLEGLEKLKPARLLISPGPCTPDEAGLSVAAIRAWADRIPVLGVCLGHQALAQAFGGRIVRARRPVHGKTSPVEHDDQGIFSGVPSPFEAGRYHSLEVERSTLPVELLLSAWTQEGEIMALRHRSWPAFGVQFHPESILTPHGALLLRRFLEI